MTFFVIQIYVKQAELTGEEKKNQMKGKRHKLMRRNRKKPTTFECTIVALSYIIRLLIGS